MSDFLYVIIDKYGIELPSKYSNGEDRTIEESFSLVERLNKNGEYRPYSIIAIERCFEIKNRYNTL